MAAGKSNGTNPFPASTLESEGALEEIGSFLQRTSDDSQSDIFLGFEVQVKSSL